MTRACRYPFGVVLMPAYLKPCQASSTSISERGSCRQNFIDMYPDG